MDFGRCAGQDVLQIEVCSSLRLELREHVDDSILRFAVFMPVIPSEMGMDNGCPVDYMGV